MKKCLWSLMLSMVLAGLTQAATTYQTGFNQSNDVSGYNYTTGDIVGQDGWYTTHTTYGNGTIVNDAIPHQGDGYLNITSVINKGVGRASGIDNSLPSLSSIVISFDLGTADPSTSDRRIDVVSSYFGLLFRVGKYSGGSSSISYAADAGENKFTGYDSSTGTWRNNSNWAKYHDGRQTAIQLTITTTGIDYYLETSWDDSPYANTVSHSYTFDTALDDLRNFGDIQFLGNSSGTYITGYVDNLSIDAIPEPGTVLLLSLGTLISFKRKRA